MLQQSKLLVCQSNYFATPSCNVLQPIKFEISGHESESSFTLSSQETPTSGSYFFDKKWLHQKVVCTEVQAPNPGFYPLPRREDNDWRLPVNLAHPFEYLLPIESW
jgi:hypothetical protein